MLINGKFCSPYYLMVKDYGELEVAQLFKLLHIDRYAHLVQENKTEAGRDSSNVLFVTRQNDWIQLMDNWGYTFWHDEKIREDMEQLFKSYELFQFSLFIQGTK